MLYWLLKPTVKTALRLWFRRIHCNGLETIDNGRSTLILANHTASFMDAILVACFVKRRIHFFARGDVFGKPWANKILRSIGLLPVYRLSEGRDKLHLNDTSNEEALKILAAGGAVLIFCEGVSDIAKRLKPLKKGPFRLAANAASTLPEAPVIVPLGINYVTPTAPGGDVFLESGTAMTTSDFIKEKGEAALAKGATDMMRQTAAALEPLVWHTKKAEDEVRADRLLLSLQHARKTCAFEETQQLMQRLNAGEVGEDAFSSSISRLSLKNMLPLILLTPPALVGWLFHAPITRLAKRVADKRVKEPDFYAPVFLSVLLLMMIGWYVIAFLIAAVCLPSLFWPPFFFVLAGCGVLYLKVYKLLISR